MVESKKTGGRLDPREVAARMDDQTAATSHIRRGGPNASLADRVEIAAGLLVDIEELAPDSTGVLRHEGEV